jgi:hypothetical protein
MLTKDLLEEDDVGLQNLERFPNTGKGERTVTNTEPFVDVVRKNFKYLSGDHAVVTSRI